ncbi:caspase family protein [Streptomyces olindensis]|uniref:caspase family protein n=1 Tax=Streptomyces olindensis TaxID=358823 RepID=UPI003652965E
MTRLPRAEESRVLLIGTSNYRADSGFTQLRNVPRNLVHLEEVLCSSELGGFLRGHCEMLLNPSSADQVRVAISRAVDEATDTLLIYYAGHAERDEKNDLYLTTSESVSGPTNIAFSGLQYRMLEERVRRAPAQNRIVILDCCHSGAANPMSGTGVLTRPAPPATVTDDEVEIEGTCVLTSCQANQVSLDSDGNGFTAFTGHLWRVLAHGVPGAPELLNLDAIYHQVVKSMRDLEQRPRKAGGDTVSELALVRNAAHEGAMHGAPTFTLPHMPPAGVPVMPSLPVAPGATPGRKGRGKFLVSLVAGAALVGVGGLGFWLGQGTGQEGKDNTGNTTPQSPSASELGAETPVASAPVTTGSGTPSKTPSTEASSTEGSRPHPGEPLPLKFTWDCSDRTWIDFDSHPFTQRMADEDPSAQEPVDTVDMVLSGCSIERFSTMRGSHAGLIPKGKPVTKSTCEAAAYGGGLENIAGGWEETGIVKEASMCVVTDKKRVVRALITDVATSPDPTIGFEVSTLT